MPARDVKKIISSVHKALGFNPLAVTIFLLKSRPFVPLIRPITTIHSEAKGVAEPLDFRLGMW